MDRLLPAEPGMDGRRVLLACDDEIVRAVAADLGCDPAESTVALARAVKREFRLGGGLHRVSIAADYFTREQRPREIPMFTGLLALTVVAAARMAQSEKNATSAYYPRLRHLLNLAGSGEIDGFSDIPRLFALLEEWLRVDQQGRRGRLFLPISPSPAYVGYCISQTVFRERDRQILSDFFWERSRGDIAGIDLLVLLRRWSGRHQLTQNALAQIDDPAVGDSVEAALETARRSWDGSVFSAAGERLWPGRLRLNLDPVGLLVSAAADEVGFGRSREAALSWDCLGAGGEHRGTVRVGGRSVRAPVGGHTLYFQLGLGGLWRVWSPTADEVTVLTRDQLQQNRLAGFPAVVGLDLPSPWRLYLQVPVGKLSGRYEEEATPPGVPVSLDRGLRLAAGLYLAGHGPVLLTGDLETADPVRVLINRADHGSMGSRDAMRLPDRPGTYKVALGDRLFSTVYHVSGHAERPITPGGLRHYPAIPEGRRRGAQPANPHVTDTVCGASVEPHVREALPIMRQSTLPVTTIDVAGTSTDVRPPAPAAWVSRVGLRILSRWELPPDGLAWVLCPENGTALCVQKGAASTLDRRAADAVRRLGAEPKLQPGPIDPVAAAADWSRLLAVALSLV